MPKEGSSGWFEDQRLSRIYEKISDKKLKTAEITGKDDIWSAFKSFFAVKGKKRVIISK